MCLQAAGGAFSILFKGGAGGAVDSIIPTLLQGLDGNAKQSSQVGLLPACYACSLSNSFVLLQDFGRTCTAVNLPHGRLLTECILLSHLLAATFIAYCLGLDPQSILQCSLLGFATMTAHIPHMGCFVGAGRLT